MTESDRFYIERCLDGHPDDFRHLVRRYQSALIAGLTYRLKNRDRAEETAQETFIRAYFNLGRLKKPDSFLPWLTSIANSVAREYRRKDKILLRQDDVSSISQTTSSAERPPDVDLDRAISALPDAYREIFRYKMPDSSSWRVIYGDLHAEELPAENARR